MRPINLIIIHCSASPNGQSLFAGRAGEPGFKTPAEVIDGWHAARGFHRADGWRQKQNPMLAALGYHFLIYLDGAIATGRHLEEVGAHAAGFNQKSIGICLIGTDRYTARQWTSLKFLVEAMQKKFEGARVVGHRDLAPDQNKNGIVEPFEWLKTCPGFDVAAWRSAGMEAPAAHILEEQP